MRIGELARHAHCDVETVRFYEREGLLDEPARETNGYRSYTAAHAAQLNFIRHCRSLGIGLTDIRMLRRYQADPAQPCDEVNALIDCQIARIHEQIETMRVLEQQLRTLRDSCNERHSSAECGIMKNLEQPIDEENCSCHADAVHAEHAGSDAPTAAKAPKKHAPH
ncbi:MULTISPECIES: Cd(II)/Pb(II)-responsive transcriptional regulator [unclassified Paraburkholderia]|uniref:Cd(II)/Pb(II)-responsive transcriptional regulator n=1 Tax=unclassified Paraburkholderia TaxID=2615204 RepID=UPI00197DE2E3|nr:MULTISPECIES: Cd(II)/Pb(II)-responsive transcriptional regulator [unclassified Paraburkholderia]MBN3853758.1 Cd(II)/Pb(II)-responsive transcriptional regulator [Paraburkholderia sp. Ac-20340]